MSVEELVKQLRSRACEIYGQTRYSNYLDQAADKLEELAAENERMRNERMWQPIETAPKDGTKKVAKDAALEDYERRILSALEDYERRILSALEDYDERT